MIVVWQVTERCNLSCPFCGFDRSLARPRNEADPLRIRQFGRVLAQYQRETGDSVLVSWLGGEPLRWAPLEGISVHYSGELALRIATTTNGTTLGSAAVRCHLLKSYTELTISVDAPGEAHDRMRGAPGLYAALSRNFRRLADERDRTGSPLRLRANVVLMRRTLGTFEQLCRELAAWGIDEISLNQLGGNDRPEFYPAQRLALADTTFLEAALPSLREELKRDGVRLLGTADYLRRMAASSRNERIPIQDCHPGTGFLFIDIQGRIAPCSFTAGTHGISVAEITSAEALRQLPARFAANIPLRRPVVCADCLSTQIFGKFAA